MKKSTICFWAVQVLLLCAAIFAAEYFTAVMFCLAIAGCVIAVAGIAAYTLYSMTKDIVVGVRSLITKKAA